MLRNEVLLGDNESSHPSHPPGYLSYCSLLWPHVGLTAEVPSVGGAGRAGLEGGALGQASAMLPGVSLAPGVTESGQRARGAGMGSPRPQPFILPCP